MYIQKLPHGGSGKATQNLLGDLALRSSLVTAALQHSIILSFSLRCFGLFLLRATLHIVPLARKAFPTISKWLNQMPCFYTAFPDALSSHAHSCL